MSTPMVILLLVLVFVWLLVVALVTVASWSDRESAREYLKRRRDPGSTHRHDGDRHRSEMRAHTWSGPCWGRWR